jgi:hypothetical protein
MILCAKLGGGSQRGRKKKSKPAPLKPHKGAGPSVEAKIENLDAAGRNGVGASGGSIGGLGG